uniref:Arginine vasopressin-induced protein 1 n=1 Tax=Electrophorus electricus TaxID=8005 RepID=A0AAY5EW48_ELEEL
RDSLVSHDSRNTLQPVFCRPVAPERRIRKSGSANIFQGVNFRQLRRLFQSGDDNAGEEEDEEGLAQALVRLRVRARNRSGIRAEPHRGDLVAATRGLRSLGHAR